jgi:hypothetical protein
LTGVTVLVDNDEYSLYDPVYYQITALATITGANSGDTLTFNLVREDGHGAVLTSAFTLTASQATQQCVFTLSAALDSDGYSIARHGLYTVQCSGTGVTTAVSSPEFRVSVITTSEMRSVWMNGVNLFSQGMVDVVQQPTIPGVEVIRIPPSHLKGAYPLVYTAGDTPTLQWNGGATVNIPSGVGRVILTEPNSTDYIECRTSSIILPGSSATDTLVIDDKQITTETIQR